MTYDIYRYIFIGAAILCALMLITSILLFILLKIPKVISDLSGRTAKKAIEEIRNQNEASGEKTYKSSLVNQQRGKITDKMSPSGRIMRNPTDSLTGAMATQKIGTQKFTSEETAVLESANETTLLGGAGSNETTLLGGGVGANETTQLTPDFAPAGNETAVLSQSQPQPQPQPIQGGYVFDIEYEITYIHTNEVIPMEVY